MNKPGFKYFTINVALLLAVSLMFGAVSSFAEATAALKELNKGFVSVAKKVTPAVVAIKTESLGEEPSHPFFFFNPPKDLPKDHPFRRFLPPFFDDEDSQGRKRGVPKRRFRRGGLGSGMIVSEDGYILTNSHVVKNSDKIEVTLSDKRKFKGKVVAQDPDTDVAIVKIDAKNLPKIEFGDSDKLQVGEIVVAIGGPFGLTKTVTSGIVSATGRDKIDITEYGDLIQTDAAINPGNSGGPLVNVDGRVIGMNVAIYSKTGGYQGIGFAIPSNTADYVMNKLLKFGKVRRGLLGVVIKDLSKPLAKSLGKEDVSGALVIKVNEDSAAEKAGIQAEDVITKFNGEPIDDMHELKKLVGQNEPGSKTTVTLFRKGKEITKTVVLGERDSKKTASAEKPKDEKPSGVLGMEVKPLPEPLAERLGLKSGEGVVVIDVDANSDAESMGLKERDIILEVDGTPVKSVSQFETLCKKAKKNKLIRLKIKRGNRPPNIDAFDLE